MPGLRQPIYLDGNATTRPLPEVCGAVVAAMGAEFGNPSSSHSGGAAARGYLRAARSDVARLLGCAPESLSFTSGATEANNTVIAGGTLVRGDRLRIVSSAVEHSSILRALEWAGSQGAEVVLLPVNRHGVIDLSALRDVVAGAPSLVSIQWVNSETGVMQPISEIGRLCADRAVPFHTDAAQAVGKLPLRLGEEPIDYASVSAHKFHGPQGVGVLYMRPGRRVRPLLHGGAQEAGRRAGTENVPGVAGMGVAAALRADGLSEAICALAALRDRFEAAVRASIRDVTVNGGGSPRVCNTSNLLLHGVDGQALVARLDQAGIQCSQTSACVSHRPEPSYVLTSMGLDETAAYSSVRFSFSTANTAHEVDHAVNVLAATVAQLRAQGRRLAPNRIMAEVP